MLTRYRLSAPISTLLYGPPTARGFLLAVAILGSLLLPGFSPALRAETETAKENQTRHTDPEKTLNELFWGKLYAAGGKTLFCEETFARKTVLIKEGYYYDTDMMRDVLECGTTSKCRTNSPIYRRMTSDMHNIFPTTMGFNRARGSARFDDVPQTGPLDKCGIRTAYGVIEPPDAIKGRVARAILHMVESYKLPMPTPIDVLIDWSSRFPPDALEKEMNDAIAALQGNRNRFIDKPARAATLR